MGEGYLLLAAVFRSKGAGLEDVQEGLLQVVGFDAADVVRGGAVQGAHEQLQ